MSLYELVTGRTGSKAIRLLQPVHYPTAPQPTAETPSASRPVYDGQPGGDLSRTTAGSLPGEVKRTVGNGDPSISPVRAARLTVGR